MFTKLTHNILYTGCGDFKIHDMSFLPDPCPLPEKEKRRALNEKEKLIYAPMSGVGGIIYDKDAVYIDLGGSHSHNKANEVSIMFFCPNICVYSVICGLYSAYYFYYYIVLQS